MTIDNYMPTEVALFACRDITTYVAQYRHLLDPSCAGTASSGEKTRARNTLVDRFDAALEEAKGPDRLYLAAFKSRTFNQYNINS